MERHIAALGPTIALNLGGCPSADDTKNGSLSIFSEIGRYLGLSEHKSALAEPRLHLGGGAVGGARQELVLMSTFLSRYTLLYRVQTNVRGVQY